MATEGQKLAGTVGLATPLFDGRTAHAGGGQAAADQIPSSLCSVVRYTTVATAADSAVLPTPPTTSSADITVINAGANSMNIYPQVGGQIDNAGANVPFALAAGKTANFFSVGSVWHKILSA